MKAKKSHISAPRSEKKEIFCYKCKKLILPKQKCISFITYKDIETKKILQENWFHENCWEQAFLKCVQERLNYEKSQALKLLQQNPMVQNLIKNMGLLKV